MQQVFQIDENGKLIDVLLIKKGEVLTEQVQVGEETIVDDEGNEITVPIYETRERQDIVYERPPDGLFEPTWNGAEWVNGLTDEEIAEIRERQEQERQEREEHRQKMEQLPEKVDELEEGQLLALEVAANLYENSLVIEQNALTALDVAATLYEELLLLKEGV